MARLMKGGLGGDESKPAYYRALRDYKIRLMKRLRELLREVANAGIADRIIVRPHPVENHEFNWRAWAAAIPNIEVRYEGNANVWMLAAEAVLHSGCTTGVEGLLLDRPVFSLIPEPDSAFLNQSDAVSQHVESADEFLERFSELSVTDQTRGRHSAKREKLGRLVANVEQPFAADRILDQLEELDLSLVSLHEAGVRSKALSPWTSSHSAQLAEGGSRPMQVTPRQRQKFPGITLDDLFELAPHFGWRPTRCVKRHNSLS